MADEQQQYQDEDRSAAKTLWLGDVQVGLTRRLLFCQGFRDHILGIVRSEKPTDARLIR